MSRTRYSGALLGAALAWSCGGAEPPAGSAAPAPAPMTGPSTGEVSASAPARPPAPARPIAGHPATADILPREAWGDTFVIATDTTLPVDELVDLADRSYRRMADWLDLPTGAAPSTPFPAYLCAELATLYELEERHGRQRSDRPGLPFDFRGGYFAEEDFIALEVRSLPVVRWQLVHEIGHLALAQRAAGAPAFVHEGLANLFAYWLLFAETSAFEEAQSLNEELEQRCRRAVQEDRVAPLRRLLDLSYLRFHDRQGEDRHYALAWHFIRFLVEEQHPEVLGRFREFLGALERGHSGWTALRRTYDAVLVERLWRAELERLLHWEPVFANWHTLSGGFRTTLDGPSSTLLLYHEPPAADATFELSYELEGAADAAPGAAVGFVVAYRSDEDFRMISVRKGGLEVWCGRYLDGVWGDAVFRRLPSGRIRPGRLRLRILSDDSLLLHVGHEQLARIRRVEGVHESRAGLMFELRDEAPAGGGAGFTFRDVRAGRD